MAFQDGNRNLVLSVWLEVTVEPSSALTPWFIFIDLFSLANRQPNLITLSAAEKTQNFFLQLIILQKCQCYLNLKFCYQFWQFALSTTMLAKTHSFWNKTALLYYQLYGSTLYFTDVKVQWFVVTDMNRDVSFRVLVVPWIVTSGNVNITMRKVSCILSLWWKRTSIQNSAGC